VLPLTCRQVSTLRPLGCAAALPAARCVSKRCSPAATTSALGAWSGGWRDSWRGLTGSGGGWRVASSEKCLFRLHLKKRIAARLEAGLWFTMERYGLCRDLQTPLQKPTAKIPISVRPLQQADLPALFDFDGASGDQTNQREVGWRRTFAAGRSGGYVAVDDRDGTPCYVQWLFGAVDNDFVRQMRSFPRLERDEALLENAYTPSRYRGMGIMSAAMAEIAERASEFGARRVLTFVAKDNIASLKGCQRAGFAPDLVHWQVRFCFDYCRWNSFRKIDSADPVRTQVF
jgi:GNAT superfamily N-acetyltransferase